MPSKSLFLLNLQIYNLQRRSMFNVISCGVFLTTIMASAIAAAQTERPDSRSSGYHRPTGEVSEFFCTNKNGGKIFMEEIGKRKLELQARSYIEVNPNFKGCVWDESSVQLAQRNPDYVDPNGGVSRFFLLEGQVHCSEMWGLKKRSITITKVVQHYAHPRDPLQDKCL